MRGIDNEFNITEGLASLVPLNDNNRSVNLYEVRSGIVTTGPSAMVGKKEALSKVIENDAKKMGNLRFMKYHCVIYQENLCCTNLKMENILNVVIKNYIRLITANFKSC
ncbi:hypothetical protein J437_LFUL004866 [Ladona fulva]|uniref:Uncharacterized protein n=1 Tax=Ladona fulva TaxID=123851 RepID=A0A8K0JTG8_LADFU|nr:hypothetical protein J437_LFUL004866 [Ladona fulva]